jgi:hypothetical protein
MSIIVQPAIDLPAVIQKEALYCAIGRCAAHLKDVIPFEGWLSHSLASEVRETNARLAIRPHHWHDVDSSPLSLDN